MTRPTFSGGEVWLISLTAIVCAVCVTALALIAIYERGTWSHPYCTGGGQVTVIDRDRASNYVVKCRRVAKK